MKNALGMVLFSMAVLHGAGAVAAQADRVEPVMQMAALDLECLDGVRMGQARAAPPAAMQQARLQEYLEFHAQVADDGRVLLPWSVPAATDAVPH
jgi:hypothetical protein